MMTVEFRIKEVSMFESGYKFTLVIPDDFVDKACDCFREKFTNIPEQDYEDISIDVYYFIEELNEIVGPCEEVIQFFPDKTVEVALCS